MWKTFTLQGFVFTGEKQRRGLCVRAQTIFRCVDATSTAAGWGGGEDFLD